MKIKLVVVRNVKKSAQAFLRFWMRFYRVATFKVYPFRAWVCNSANSIKGCIPFKVSFYFSVQKEAPSLSDDMMVIAKNEYGYLKSRDGMCSSLANKVNKLSFEIEKIKGAHDKKI